MNKKTRAIFPSLSDDSNKRRLALHQQFLEEIFSLKDKEIHVILFALADLSFAIEIDKIEEVVITPTITPLPKSPEYVLGIAEVRNTGIIILDLSAKLGLSSPVDNYDNSYTIVVSSKRFTVGIITPTIPDNLEIKGSNIQPTGYDIAGNPEDETYIKGVIKIDKKQAYFIDIDELIEGDRIELSS